jgi:hypothetical protein
MESMGTMATFFSEGDDNSFFTHQHFLEWLNGDVVEGENEEMRWPNVQPQIAALIPPDTGVTLDDLVQQLMQFLQEQQDQWNIANPQEVEADE